MTWALPFSWLWRGAGASPKSWGERVFAALLAAGWLFFWLVALPSLVWGHWNYTVFVWYAAIGEVLWVLPQPAEYGLALHALRTGHLLGWPPYGELRLWRFHVYFGFEPLGQSKPRQFDLSARLMWHH